MVEYLGKLMQSNAGRASLMGALLVLGAVVAFLVLRKHHSDVEHRRASAATRMAALVMVLLGVLVGAQVVIDAQEAVAPDSLFTEVFQNIFWTVLALLIAYLVVTLSQRALLNNTTNLDVRHRVRSNVKWIGLLLLLVVVALIWVRGVKDMSVLLGLVGAGIALAFQETLLCIAGWVIIIATKPFDIGDRVEVDKRIGDVIDIGLFQTSMLEVGNWVVAEQSTGRMLIVPNSVVFRHAVYNYTKGFPFIWNEFSTIVTFESDWKAAREIMVSIAQEFADTVEQEVSERMAQMQSRYAIRFGHLSPVVYMAIVDNGVRLTLRYLTEVRRRRGTEQKIAEGVLDGFLAHPKIDLAYPTTRMYRNDAEGKPDLGGHPRGDA